MFVPLELIAILVKITFVVCTHAVIPSGTVKTQKVMRTSIDFAPYGSPFLLLLLLEKESRLARGVGGE